MVHRLEAEYWGEVDFIYLDADERYTRDIRDLWIVTYTPTFVLIDAAGHEIHRWTYNDDINDWRQRLDAVLDG